MALALSEPSTRRAMRRCTESSFLLLPGRTGSSIAREVPRAPAGARRPRPSRAPADVMSRSRLSSRSSSSRSFFSAARTPLSRPRSAALASNEDTSLRPLKSGDD